MIIVWVGWQIPYTYIYTHTYVFWRKQTLLEGAERCWPLYRDFCPHPGPMRAVDTFVVPGVAVVIEVVAP